MGSFCVLETMDVQSFGNFLVLLFIYIVSTADGWNKKWTKLQRRYIMAEVQVRVMFPLVIEFGNF